LYNFTCDLKQNVEQISGEHHSSSVTKRNTNAVFKVAKTLKLFCKEADVKTAAT